MGAIKQCLEEVFISLEAFEECGNSIGVIVVMWLELDSGFIGYVGGEHMEKQKIAVSWEMCGFIEVEENTLEEAMENFKQNPDKYELPRDGEYVDGSFSLSTDDVDAMEMMVRLN